MCQKCELKKMNSSNIDHEPQKVDLSNNVNYECSKYNIYGHSETDNRGLPFFNRIVFNETEIQNDLEGDLCARIMFAQSQIIPSHPREDDKQPVLTARRKTLLMVQPFPEQGPTSQLRAIVTQKNNLRIDHFDLLPPHELPKTAYYEDNVLNEEIDFTPAPGSTRVINTQNELSRLNDPKGHFLLALLKENALVKIETANQQWVSDIYLPSDMELEGKMIYVDAGADWSTTVHYRNTTYLITYGKKNYFKFHRAQWNRQGEGKYNGLIYANNTWSVILPEHCVLPGMSIHLIQGDYVRTGVLKEINVSAHTQLLLHTIDIGMLTTPRGEFAFAKDLAAQREYFQTVPISQMIVNQYAPLYLPEVMLPDGTLLTDYDPSEGGWHSGTMRERITKGLIGHGLNLANYGINSTANVGGSDHPFTVTQLSAHNSRGKYANGIQIHGGSGGGGLVTLDVSIGNEFSHEVGHNYGLGHYPGGFKGSVHREASAINSTWGWDMDRNRFIPNFYITPYRDACLDGECQPPFHGNTFGFDAMAAGGPFSVFNRFTLHTPYCAADIQRFLVSKAVFSVDSPTGFRKWNPDSMRMEPYVNKFPVYKKTKTLETKPGLAVSTELMSRFFTLYDLVDIPIRTEGRIRVNMPLASAENHGCALKINNLTSSPAGLLLINGEIVDISRSFVKKYVSDGKLWNERPLDEGETRERIAHSLGIPVVTLVGFYDPENRLSSFIYPALHGAYGFCYDDDSENMGRSTSQLWVETEQGRFKYALANHRLGDPTYMNQFHINIPASTKPYRVSLLHNGTTVHQRDIQPTTETLSSYTYGHGEPDIVLQTPETLTVTEADEGFYVYLRTPKDRDGYLFTQLKTGSSWGEFGSYQKVSAGTTGRIKISILKNWHPQGGFFRIGWSENVNNPHSVSPEGDVESLLVVPDALD